MKQLKRDVQAVAKELKALVKKAERVTKAVAKLGKGQAAKKRKPKVKAKAKARKKAPAKRKVAAKKKVARKKVAKKKVAKKKVAKKKVAKKKAAGLTATDKVLRIIKMSKKGVDAPTLIKKTGLKDKQIRNILFRASSQRKIKRAGRGIYVAK